MQKKSSTSAENREKKRKKISLSYLENAGAYYLQRFSASTAQFRRVLSRKISLSCRDHPEQNRAECLALLDQVVVKFENLGYLNDESYAKNLLYSLEQKNFAHSRILSTLKMKGVPEDILGNIFPPFNETTDLAAARHWLRKKKIGPYAIRIRENEYQKSIAALARAGFSYDTARRALEEIEEKD